MFPLHSVSLRRCHYSRRPVARALECKASGAGFLDYSGGEAFMVLHRQLCVVDGAASLGYISNFVSTDIA